jgi:hypothetical protein
MVDVNYRIALPMIATEGCGLGYEPRSDFRQCDALRRQGMAVAQRGISWHAAFTLRQTISRCRLAHDAGM